MASSITLVLIALMIHGCLALLCWECNNAVTNEECIANGVLKRCNELDAICEDQIRHGDGGNTIIIEKRCKQRLACHTNVAQNLRPAYPIQCNLKSPTSACRCCCNTDGCNHDLLTCWQGYPTHLPEVPTTCDQLPYVPGNGNMQCRGNKEPGTQCDFQCHTGYYLVGEPILTCLSNYTWDYPPPRCELKKCPPPLEVLDKGSVSCSNENYLRSRCTFKCNPNHRLVGRSYAECHDTSSRKYGVWSGGLPECKPLFCKPQGPLFHGTFHCTDRRKVNSVCTWRCFGDFQIHPKGYDVNVCLETGEWDKPWPCCTLPCPPYAVMDLVVVLDSSSSVSEPNWILMKRFVRLLLQKFALRQDSALYSVFRYNRVVDYDTQIFFDDHTDINSFLDAYDEIPYDGNGTYTGNALNHVTDAVLVRGNRPLAPDIVLLITDGASQDEVAGPAQRLRDSGAIILVIPVKPPKGKLNLEQIDVIVGPDKEGKVIKDAVDVGFRALDEDLANSMASRLCPSPCSNPFHGHDPFLPLRLRGIVV